MRNRLAIVLSVVGGVLAMAGPLLAHHAAALYDHSREVKMEGAVVEFRMVNPHPQLIFTVKGPDGIEEWFAESQRSSLPVVQQWLEHEYRKGRRRDHHYREADERGGLKQNND